MRIQVKILESKLESLGGKVSLKGQILRENAVKIIKSVQSIFKWNTTSSASSTTPSSVFKQPSNSAIPALPTPPARKRIGPKAKTFVSHMSDENPLPINSFISDNKQPDQDLIKW